MLCDCGCRSASAGEEERAQRAQKSRRDHRLSQGLKESKGRIDYLEDPKEVPEGVKESQLHRTVTGAVKDYKYLEDPKVVTRSGKGETFPKEVPC